MMKAKKGMTLKKVGYLKQNEEKQKEKDDDEKKKSGIRKRGSIPTL